MLTQYFIINLSDVNGEYSKILDIFMLVHNADQWFAKPKIKAKVDLTAELSYPLWQLKIMIKADTQSAIDYFEEELEKAKG